jgi:hypothetical protein
MEKHQCHLLEQKWKQAIDAKNWRSHHIYLHTQIEFHKISQNSVWIVLLLWVPEAFF